MRTMDILQFSAMGSGNGIIAIRKLVKQVGNILYEKIFPWEFS